MIRAWTHLSIVDYWATALLRGSLDAATPDRFEPEANPHVSVLPGFEVPESTADGVLADVRSDEAFQALADAELEATGLRCFPALDEPEATVAVVLDVDVDLAAVREAQREIVEAAGGSLVYEPVEPHVTLVKQADVDESAEALSAHELAELREMLEDLGREPAGVDAGIALGVDDAVVETV